MLARGSGWKFNLQKGARVNVLSFSGHLPGERRIVALSSAPRLEVAKLVSK